MISRSNSNVFNERRVKIKIENLDKSISVALNLTGVRRKH